jgi:L-alanine-DL-glutamate epimerase-like enolase superfamily enzyme
MKITKTDIWTVVVPTIPGTVHSPEYGEAGWDKVPKHIIRINTDEGLCGIGETGRGVPKGSVEALAKDLEGKDPRNLLLQHLPSTCPVELSNDPEWWKGQAAGPTMAGYEAIEMAIFDLVGKIFERPAHWFLGGAIRDRVAADFWIGHQTPEHAARSTKIAVERGFKGLKMKCKIGEPMVERCEAIWDVAGRDFRLTIDPNTRFYHLPETIALARELAPRGHVEVFEDPMLKDHLDWYREFKAEGIVPVALHLGSPVAILDAIKADACDYLNLGGSMVQFVRNAAIAHAASIPVWHGSGNDLGIMEFSYLHAAAAARNCVLASDFVGSWTREDDLVVDGLQFDKATVIVPQIPGLGCELDMDAVEKYRVE